MEINLYSQNNDGVEARPEGGSRKSRDNRVSYGSDGNMVNITDQNAAEKQRGPNEGQADLANLGSPTGEGVGMFDEGLGSEDRGEGTLGKKAREQLLRESS